MTQSELDFVSLNAFHVQQNTIQHWQLRDLISVDKKGTGVYYVKALPDSSHGRVHHYNTVTQKRTLICELGFAPTCMTAAHGYLAAGGSRSQLVVVDLSNNMLLHWSHIGGTVNNALHIGRDSTGNLVLCVANNNRSVKMFSLPGVLEVGTVRLGSAINYSALSPDGGHLLCVGDANEALLCRATPSGYQCIAALNEFHDAGMCCAWNSAGTCYAAASQDGSVVVWDHRTRAVVRRHDTGGGAHAAGARVPCRCVKFSPSPIDLMAFSAHDATVHVVDARFWRDTQTVIVGESGPFMDWDGAGVSGISGLAFAEQGTSLFVGVENTGIAVYDINADTRLSFPYSGII